MNFIGYRLGKGKINMFA